MLVIENRSLLPGKQNGISSPTNTYLEIKKRLENRFNEQLRKRMLVVKNKIVDGASPPSVFVGQHGYPKVGIGPMMPAQYGNTSIMDLPEKWKGLSLDQIANYRFSLIRGISMMKIEDITGKYIETLQQMVMSKRSIESEMHFDDMIIERRVLDSPNIEYSPFGPSAYIKSFTTSNPSIDKRIENMFYERDIISPEAIMNLYKNNIEVSKISKVFSLGMLGRYKNRKLVPTRWSISAIDDIISTNLLKTIHSFESIENIGVFKYSHLANFYSIVLLPTETWEFEMIEAWSDQTDIINSSQITNMQPKYVLASDYENVKKINHNPNIAGAFFAARLAMTEYLSAIKRKAAILIFREIHPEYMMPLGVWQIREGIRSALKENKREFENFKDALKYSLEDMSSPRERWLKISKIYDLFKNQTRITEFL